MIILIMMIILIHIILIIIIVMIIMMIIIIVRLTTLTLTQMYVVREVIFTMNITYYNIVLIAWHIIISY